MDEKKLLQVLAEQLQEIVLDCCSCVRQVAIIPQSEPDP